MKLANDALTVAQSFIWKKLVQWFKSCRQIVTKFETVQEEKRIYQKAAHSLNNRQIH